MKRKKNKYSTDGRDRIPVGSSRLVSLCFNNRSQSKSEIIICSQKTYTLYFKINFKKMQNDTNKFILYIIHNQVIINTERFCTH